MEICCTNNEIEYKEVPRKASMLDIQQFTGVDVCAISLAHLFILAKTVISRVSALYRMSIMNADQCLATAPSQTSNDKERSS